MESKFKDEEIRSVSPAVAPAKSVLMKAQQNVLGTVAEVAVKAAEAATEATKEAAPKVKGSRLTAKLVKQAREENKREERDEVELPELAPLGDKNLWNFKINPKAQKNWSELNEKDKIVAKLIGGIHLMCLAAPFTYSASAVPLMLGGYLFSILGITLSYHRQLTHKSFETDKWLEHFWAFVGVLAVQGHPIEWVSAHRHHHTQCEDVADPHSPKDGFFWSHMGWLFDSRANALLFDTTNVKDLKKDNFY